MEACRPPPRREYGLTKLACKAGKRKGREAAVHMVRQPARLDVPAGADYIIGNRPLERRLQMFIQTETTPNPASLKFLPGRIVLGTGTAEFRDADEAARSPLAERLFGVDGVGGVFLGSDFITVTKTDGEWQHLKPAVLGAIMEHFLSGMPVLRAEADEASGEFFAEEDAETVATIKELIETRVRPAVAQDGGDITFQGFRDGVVYLQHARLLRRLPVLDGDAEARHPELAAPLRAGSAARSRKSRPDCDADVTTRRNLLFVIPCAVRREVPHRRHGISFV